jgi:hypothetical protein
MAAKTTLSLFFETPRLAHRKKSENKLRLSRATRQLKFRIAAQPSYTVLIVYSR